jgi:hypothetical protein
VNRDFGEKGICFGLAVMVNRHGFLGESYLFCLSVMVSGGSGLNKMADC